MNDANQWIEALQMQQHPEGGWFSEVYRAHESIAHECLPARFSGERSFSTAIYFLLQDDDFSAFHRIAQDELWHFYDGTSLTLHVLCARALLLELLEHVVGNRLDLHIGGAARQHEIVGGGGDSSKIEDGHVVRLTL